jgi:hypothetical protein
MKRLSFSILMQRKLQARCRPTPIGIYDETWFWTNRGRYYALRARIQTCTKDESDVVTNVELFERVMPESETSMEPVCNHPLGKGDLSGMDRDEVTCWIYKGMLKAILK